MEEKFAECATIVLLDYSNIGEYLDVNELGVELFSGKFNRSQVADAIRVALLAKYGGVWIDCDTIILKSDAEKYFLPNEEHKTVFFGYPKGRSCIIGYINSPSDAKCMTLWLQYVKEKIQSATHTTKFTWNFMGNAFLDDYLKKNIEGVKIIDDNLIRPEKKFVTSSKSFKEAYTDYYFLQNHHLKDLQNDMLYLHNSWTPPFYKNLSMEELLRCDCTMTNVLAEALEIELPHPSERRRFEEIIKN